MGWILLAFSFLRMYGSTVMCHKDGCCLLLKTYFAKFTMVLLSDFKMPCVTAVYQDTSTFCHISISHDDNLAEASPILYL